VNGQVGKDPTFIGHKPDSRKSDLMGLFVSHFHPFVPYRPAYRRSQAHNRPERGRFAHAVSAQKGYDLSLAYLQRNIEKNMAFPVVCIDLTKL
jgi:hypothetical protein